MIDANLLLFAREGTLPAGAVRVLAQTAPYDHCKMTAGPSAAPTAPGRRRVRELLLAMSYADAQLRPLLDLEGLKQWRPPRLSGYDQLERAVDEAGFYDADGEITRRPDVTRPVGRRACHAPPTCDLADLGSTRAATCCSTGRWPASRPAGG